MKSHRKLTVKCPDCRIQRTDAALRYGEEWLFNIAIAAWNRRTPNTRALAALEAVEGAAHGTAGYYGRPPLRTVTGIAIECAAEDIERLVHKRVLIIPAEAVEVSRG